MKEFRRDGGIMINGVPKNIAELKKMANNKTNWRERLESVNLLKEYNCQQTKDIVTRLALHDSVFRVKEAAFKVAQSFGIKKNGKPIYLGKKKKGNLVKEINKKLANVKNNLDSGFTLDEFKEKFKAMYPEHYDVYEGDKENRFDNWLESIINCLPNQK